MHWLLLSAAPELKLSITTTFPGTLGALSCSNPLPPASQKQMSVNLKGEVNLSAWKNSYLDHHLKGKDTREDVVEVAQDLEGGGGGVGGDAWGPPGTLGPPPRYLPAPWGCGSPLAPWDPLAPQDRPSTPWL